MKMFSLDYGKHGLEYLKAKQLADYTDDDIRKLTSALSAEIIAPRMGIAFEPNNVQQLLRMSKCRRCGKCCMRNKLVPDDPGIMVYDFDLVAISKKTKHSLKALNKIARVNANPTYNVGARYLPLPCMFYDKNAKSCKIYPFRPFICQIYPVSDSPEKDVTIDVRCDFGKEIFQKTFKHIRDMEKGKRVK